MWQFRYEVMRHNLFPRGLLPAALSGLAAAFAVVAVSGAASAADPNTSLPILSACQRTAPPELPPRWRAVGLLFPFVRQQLDVGEFIYDGTLPAMRATLYGMESGAVDLLITDKETYQLTGPHDSPDACIALGSKYRPPPSRWLSSEATCDGESPLASQPVEWWKTGAADGRSDWQWYRTSNRLPWRVMFSSRAAEPAVIGDYGMSYFPTFTPLQETNLAKLRDLCAAKVRKAPDALAAAATARDLMASNDMAGAERAKAISALVPGLSRQACSTANVPIWPHNYVMTGILTPIPAKWTPLPSMIYYDWEHATTLFAWMYEARTVPAKLELVSVLTKGVGYSVERLPNGNFVCAAKSPGAVRPDWMAVAGCDCKAVIEHNPDFGADEVTQIRACPLKEYPLHVIWSWYTNGGRPILFTEPGAIGSGINIADYFAWQPGAKMPPESFALPQLCTRAEDARLPPVGHGLPALATRSCSDCHTTER